MFNESHLNFAERLVGVHVRSICSYIKFAGTCQTKGEGVFSCPILPIHWQWWKLSPTACCQTSVHWGPPTICWTKHRYHNCQDLDVFEHLCPVIKKNLLVVCKWRKIKDCNLPTRNNWISRFAIAKEALSSCRCTASVGTMVSGCTKPWLSLFGGCSIFKSDECSRHVSDEVVVKFYLPIGYTYTFSGLMQEAATPFRKK